MHISRSSSLQVYSREGQFVQCAAYSGIFVRVPDFLDFSTVHAGDLYPLAVHARTL